MQNSMGNKHPNIDLLRLSSQLHLYLLQLKDSTHNSLCFNENIKKTENQFKLYQKFGKLYKAIEFWLPSQSWWLWWKAWGAVRSCQMCLQGTESTASPLCLSAASHTGRSLSSPLLPCALASSDTPGSPPSAGNSAPVDTRGENTKHLTKYLGHLDMEGSQGWSASYTMWHYTSYCTFTDYKQMF